MKKALAPVIVAGFIAATSSAAQATGFTKVQIPDTGSKQLDVGIWYPSNQQPPIEPNTEFGLALALDAPLSKSNGGFIVLSHGYSGWYAGHADTAAALADAGFIVAAPSHAGNTWSDMSSTPEKWILDRPRHISRVIDYVLADEIFSPQISEEKIGVYGFSAGGYTAVGLIGGIPDLNQAATHCENHPQEYVCAEGLIDAMLAAEMNTLPSSAWGADPRVTVASISAPGFAFAYTEASLKAVGADVQLWSGQLDKQVPTETNAGLLAQRLPIAPETHWVDDANHFAFLVVPCRDEFKESDPTEYDIVCGDKEGFDRHTFHGEMHVEMVRFFKSGFGI